MSDSKRLGADRLKEIQGRIMDYYPDEMTDDIISFALDDRTELVAHISAIAADHELARVRWSKDESVLIEHLHDSEAERDAALKEVETLKRAGAADAVHAMRMYGALSDYRECGESPLETVQRLLRKDEGEPDCPDDCTKHRTCAEASGTGEAECGRIRALEKALTKRRKAFKEHEEAVHKVREQRDAALAAETRLVMERADLRQQIETLKAELAESTKFDFQEAALAQVTCDREARRLGESIERLMGMERTATLKKGADEAAGRSTDTPEPDTDMINRAHRIVENMGRDRPIETMPTIDVPKPNVMDAPDGPVCQCGSPSTREDGSCESCGRPGDAV